MSDKMPNPRTLVLLLALPILGILALVGYKEATISRSTTMRAPITGYDPRDYMYGHYLRFRFAGEHPIDTTAHEYFVPEDAAPALEALLRKRVHELSIDVHMNGDAMTFGALYIDNVPWREYLTQHPDETK